MDAVLNLPSLYSYFFKKNFLRGNDLLEKDQAVPFFLLLNTIFEKDEHEDIGNFLGAKGLHPHTRQF